MTTARHDFATIIPAGMEQHAAELRGVGATVEICVSGAGGGTWTVVMDENMAVWSGSAPDPDARFSFNADAWQEFMQDPTRITQLFMAKKLEVEGNAVYGLKLQYLVPEVVSCP